MRKSHKIKVLHKKTRRKLQKCIDNPQVTILVPLTRKFFPKLTGKVTMGEGYVYAPYMPVLRYVHNDISKEFKELIGDVNEED